MDGCAWWGVINPFIPPLSSPDPAFLLVALSPPGAASSRDVRSDNQVLGTPQGVSPQTSPDVVGVRGGGIST